MDIEKALGTVALVIGLGLAALGTVAVVGSVRANGNIDYCYVEMLSPQGMAPQYQLHGHRPWREDRSMGVYPTIDEAKQKADTLGCKFGGS